MDDIIDVDFESIEVNEDRVNELIKSDTKFAELTTSARSELILKEVFVAMESKYKLGITFENFNEFLTSITKKENADEVINRLVASKVIRSLSERVVLKAMVTNAILIEKALDIMEKQAASQKKVDEVLVVMIEKIFNWMSELNNIRALYDKGNVDAQLSKMAESGKLELSSDQKAEASRLLLELVKNVNKAPKDE